MTSRRSTQRTPRRIPALWLSVALILLFVVSTGSLGIPSGRSIPGSLGSVTGGICGGHRSSVVRPTTTPRDATYLPHPAQDVTFDATGIVWRPDLSTYPVNVEGEARVCWLGGTILGSIPPNMTWEVAHEYNQPCLRIVATGWMLVEGLRCNDTGDGIRPRETETGSQNVSMMIRGTYLTRIHDDCLENDGIIGGMVRDSLWDGCNTGISERPSDTQGGFAQPSGETLILDHMLIGLGVSPHQDGGAGENALFKWSASANELVIRCSIFKVDSVSLNGPETMEVPGRIDDRACPRRPSTIVWLGGGAYPGRIPAGMQVTSDIQVWEEAVSQWRCEHQVHALGSRLQPTPSAEGA